jgi:glycosyltransferase involved in cell wall biosynthesis
VDADFFSGIKSERGSVVNLGFLGGLDSKIKGLDLLIKALADIEIDNFFLHIGGDGLLLDYYRDLADKNGILTRCRFFGDIKREDIAEFYSKLDIFILPSRYETFGVVLIEAMAAGIPVIATKCGGPEEIVNEMNGILIEKENAHELKEAIKTMAYRLDQYDHNAISNYAKINFGKEAFVEKINRIYRVTLEGNNNEE